MAAKSRVVQAGAAAYAARNNPYLQRLVQDPELRDNLRTALVSARSAYGRLSNGKGPAKAIVEDRKLHRDLQRAADALSASQAALKEGPKRRRRRGGFGLGRLLLLLIVGGAVALGVSEGLRNKVLDLVFGAEEEFDYTSTTTPPPPPAPAPAGQSTN